MRLFRRHNEVDVAELKLVIGLGNPGRRYEGTRHNMGLMIVDALAERYGLRFGKSKHLAETARGDIKGMSVLLARPLSYMNESGNTVVRLVNYYNVALESLMVVHDEMDLPFGTLRLRPRGTSAGNRGIESIIQSLRTNEFARLRVGVGRPEHGAISHVLSPFPADQRRVLPELVRIAGDAAIDALRDGVQTAMNNYNRDWSAELDNRANEAKAK